MPYKWWEKEGIEHHPLNVMMDPDRYHVAINNILPAVRGQFASMPKKVVIEDDTLREGIECPHGLWGRNTTETRVKIARALEDAGIEEVQVGFVHTDPIAQELVRDLRRETPGLKPVCHVGTTKESIDGTVDQGVYMGWMMLKLNDWDIQRRTLWSGKKIRMDTETHIIEDICEHAVSAIEYAKDRGMYIRAGSASPIFDPINRLAALLKAEVDAGADGAWMGDGPGAGIPEAFKFLTAMARSILGPDKDIEGHWHNDYGLGTANAIAAVTAGCDVISCSVHGLGDRAGITALEEVVTILEILYGVDTGVDMEKLWPLSQLVSELYGIRLSQNKAIVGENTYVHEEDPHISRVIRSGRKWWGYNTINPEYLGRRQHLHWGGSSMHKGPNSCTALKIAEMGFSYDEKKLNDIIERATEIAKRRRYATEEEVEKIIRDTYK